MKYTNNQKLILDKMKEFNKELRLKNHTIQFCEETSVKINQDKRNYRSKLIDQLKFTYRELERNIFDARFMENYILGLLPNSEQIKIECNGTAKYELDCVAVYHNCFFIASISLDSREVNVYEHLYEVCIHALRYGGLDGVSCLIVPNYSFPEKDYDKDENGIPNFKTIYGVRIFDEKSFMNGETIDHKHFEKEIADFINIHKNYKDASGYALIDSNNTKNIEADFELESILQHSDKSLTYISGILAENANFIEEHSPVRLDECLFMYLGVRTNEEHGEWVLIANIDVPAYENNRAKKYRMMLYQYIATALKYTGGQFKMLVFHNYEKSLQHDAKTLGDFLSMKVWTMNTQEYRAYDNRIGMYKLLKRWVNGDLKGDESLKKQIREINESLSGLEIPLTCEGDALIYGCNHGPVVSNAVKEVINEKPKQGTKFVAKYSKDLQFIGIDKIEG